MNRRNRSLSFYTCVFLSDWNNRGKDISEASPQESVELHGGGPRRRCGQAFYHYRSSRFIQAGGKHRVGHTCQVSARRSGYSFPSDTSGYFTRRNAVAGSNAGVVSTASRRKVRRNSPTAIPTCPNGDIRIIHDNCPIYRCDNVGPAAFPSRSIIVRTNKLSNHDFIDNL